MWANRVPAVPREVCRLEWEAPPEEQVLYIVGIDPGVTTGWCVLRIPYRALMVSGFRAVALNGIAWRVGQWTGPAPFQAEHCMALCRGVWAEGEWRLGTDSDLFLVTIESFTLRVQSTDASLLAPVRVTEAIHTLSWRTLPAPVVQFTPSDALTVMPDSRLHALNMYTPGREDHRRDATRHAILAARKMGEPGFRNTVLARMAWLHQEMNNIPYIEKTS